MCDVTDRVNTLNSCVLKLVDNDDTLQSLNLGILQAEAIDERRSAKCDKYLVRVDLVGLVVGSV